MTETMLEKILFDRYCNVLVWSTSTKIEGEGFMTYSAASHHGVIETFWLHFWGAVTLSFFIYVNAAHISPAARTALDNRVNYPRPFSLWTIKMANQYVVPQHRSLKRQHISRTESTVANNFSTLIRFSFAFLWLIHLMSEVWQVWGITCD